MLTCTNVVLPHQSLSSAVKNMPQITRFTSATITKLNDGLPRLHSDDKDNQPAENYSDKSNCEVQSA